MPLGSRDRETFSSRLGLVLTTVGVAAGLGNVWRFPYMAGQFGGGAFVLVHVAAAMLIGVPALAAEWTLGLRSRSGPVTAYGRAGLPGGRAFGSGMQTLGALAAAVTVGWALDRSAALEELAAGVVEEPEARRLRLLLLWIRWVVPAAVLATGVWWMATEVIGG